MPAFTFTSPQGQQYTVTAPEGATQDQAFAILQQHLAATQAPAQQQPSTPSFLDSLGHAAGVAGRAVANGLLGIPEMAADAADSAINTGNDLLHGRNPITNDQPIIGSSSQAFNDLLTRMGVPQPQNGMEQLESGVIGALAGSRAPIPGAATSPAARLVQPGQTAGQVMQSPVLQAVESTLARLPGGGAISQAVRNQTDALGTKVTSIVDNLRNGGFADPEGAGSTLQKGLTAAANRIKTAAGAQFDEILDQIPNNAKIPVTNTVNTLEDLTALPKGAENTAQHFVDPRLTGLLQAVQKDMEGASPAGIVGPDGQVLKSGNGLLPIDAVRRLKTMLGGMINWEGSGDAVNGALKKVYGSLTQDIGDGARLFNPKLGAMIEAANKDYQVATAQVDVLHSVIDKAGGPEKIFTSLMSGTKDGASTIRQVVSHLSPVDRQLLAAAQLRRMGLANPGAQGAAGDAFSANTFLTNWNRMDPEARAVLFGQLPDNYASSVTRLAQNAEALRRYTNIIPNASNTAQASLHGGVLGSGLLALLTGDLKIAAGIGGSVLSNKLLASALTNPKTVAWLARQTTPSAAKALAAGVGGTMGASAPTGAAGAP